MQALHCYALLQYIITVQLATAQSPSPQHWDYSVYTGRHFNTLVTSSIRDDDIIIKPAILFLYEPSCEASVMELKDQLRPWGPNDIYLTIAFHDYETYPNHIWYKLDEIDDLKKRYVRPKDPCKKVLYFEEGTRLHNPQVWDGMENIYEWVWQKFTIEILINNLLYQTIVPKKDGQGDPWIFSEVEPYSSGIVKPHLGLALTISDTRDKLLYAIWLEPEHHFVRLDVTQELVDEFQNRHGLIVTVTADEWQKSYRHLKEKESTEEKKNQREIASVFLFTFKQPIILPIFTKTGYFKTKIPTEVNSKLKTFYDTKRTGDGGLQNETMNSFFAINGDQVKTGMVELTDDIKSCVHEALLMQMQDWCQCELEATFFYGIREYYRSNLLRMHVDRIETHVISSILQIDQDLNGQEDWLLEVIDFNGERQHVKLLPGEMLLYESATLIHGRPTTFKGRFFANCFLHYKPRSDWTWHREQRGPPMGHVITDGKDIVEPEGVIDTPRLFQASLRSVRDEL